MYLCIAIYYNTAFWLRFLSSPFGHRSCHPQAHYLLFFYKQYSTDVHITSLIVVLATICKNNVLVSWASFTFYRIHRIKTNVYEM